MTGAQSSTQDLSLALLVGLLAPLNQCGGFDGKMEHVP